MAKNKSTQNVESTYDKLLRLGKGIEEELKLFQSMSIKEPRSSQYTLVNINKECARFLIDGGVVTDLSKRCDKLVLIKLDDQRWVQIFIELKGTDVSKAFEQIRETLSKDLFKDSVTHQKLAHIVCSSVPKDRSDVRRTQIIERFKKDYKCKLTVVSNGAQISLKKDLI